MRMKSYDDVVDGPSRAAAVEWLREAQEYTLPEITEVPVMKMAYETQLQPYTTKKGLKKVRKKRVKLGMHEIRVKYHAEKNPLQSALSRIILHSEKEPELGARAYDPWKAWQTEKEKWSEKLVESDKESNVPAWVKSKDERAEEEKVEKALEAICEIEGKLGRIPSRGLRRVPKEKAVRYACADPDGTLRVAKVLEQLAARVGREIAEEDWAK
jgi:hypothetical protein